MRRKFLRQAETNSCRRSSYHCELPASRLIVDPLHCCHEHLRGIPPHRHSDASASVEDVNGRFSANCQSGFEIYRLPATRCQLVVIRATQVIPAMRAHQLAFVAAQTMRTGRADLAMMIHRRLLKRNRIHATLRRTPSYLFVKNTGPLGQHGSEINAFLTIAPCRC